MKKILCRAVAAIMLTAAMLPPAICSASSTNNPVVKAIYDFENTDISDITLCGNESALLQNHGLGYRTGGTAEGKGLSIIQDSNGNKKLRISGGIQQEGNTATDMNDYIKFNASVGDSYTDESGDTKLVVSVKYAQNSREPNTKNSTNNHYGLAVMGSYIKEDETTSTFQPIFRGAVRNIGSNLQTPVLCFGGPSGTGNTTLYNQDTSINTEYRIDMVVDLKANTAKAYVDGVLKLEKQLLFDNSLRDIKSVDSLMLYVCRTDIHTLDDIKMYTLGSDYSFTAASGNTEDISVRDGLTLSFNGFVDETTLEGISVSKNGTVISPEQYTIASELNIDAENNASTDVVIKFNNSLDYDTQYSVSVPDTVTDELSNAAAPASFTYTTEKASSFNITLSASKGFNTGGTVIESLADAAGSMIYASAAVTNITGGTENARATAGTAFIGLFSGDECIGYGSTSKLYDANVSDEMSFSISIPEDTAGLTLKAFVCKDLFNINDVFSDVIEVN